MRLSVAPGLTATDVGIHGEVGDDEGLEPDGGGAVSEFEANLLLGLA